MRRLLLSFALFGLAACTVNSNPGPAGPQPGAPEPATDKPTDKPPGAQGGESAQTPVGTPELPEGVVVAPREPAGTPGAPPADKPDAGAVVECTVDKRKGGMCTREFRPVCGAYADRTSKTFSNPCVACSDEKVVSYVAGGCAAK